MTIKEAADLLEITKTGVMYHLRAMGDPLAKDERGRIVIDEDTVQRIRERIETAKRKDKPANLARSDGANFAKTSRKQDFEEFLQNQISVKDEEIAKLYDEIASLTAQLSDVTAALKSAQNALEGAQALHAATMKKQLQEAQEPEPVTIAGDEAEPDEQEEEEHKQEQEDHKQDEPEEEHKQEQEPPKRSLWARIFGRR